jgi:hypothetical protein
MPGNPAAFLYSAYLEIAPAGVLEMRWDPLFRDRSCPCAKCGGADALLCGNTSERDYLRGEAYRVSRDAKTDWYAEPRKLGTAFCFEDANARTRFCAICVRENVTYATEHPGN